MIIYLFGIFVQYYAVISKSIILSLIIQCSTKHSKISGKLFCHFVIFFKDVERKFLLYEM